MRLMDVDKYCEFLNTYPLEKAQSNFMTFYRDALQHTFECEIKAIPIEWLENFMNKLPRDNSTDGMSWTSMERWGIKMAISEWEKENDSK